MRKKIVLILIIIILFFFIFILKKSKINSTKKQDIIFFNWSEYIEPSIIHEFNANSNKFNVKQIFLSSNELAINKIKAGNKYDIAILSEYAIEQLKENYLEQIQSEKIQNIEEKKYFDRFTENFKQIKEIKKEDKIWEYTIPYFWGKLGLLYRKDKFGDKLNEQKLIKNLKNSDYKIALYNNPFEVIFLGLKITGGDISVNSKKDIDKAKQFLLSLKKENNNLSFITDQLLDRMKIKNQEYYDIAVAYSGDARYLMQQNNNLGYYQFNSEEDENKGTNVWFDGLVLPKGTNKEGAYEFIDFLLKPENIKKNRDFIGYDSPYIDYEELNDDKIKLKINKEDKIYKYNEEYKKQINDAWNEVYAYPISKDKYLIILSFIILLFFSYIFFFKKIN